jgi:hypothetical protein
VFVHLLCDPLQPKLDKVDDAARERLLGYQHATVANVSRGGGGNRAAIGDADITAATAGNPDDGFGGAAIREQNMTGEHYHDRGVDLRHRANHPLSTVYLRELCTFRTPRV